MARPEVTGRKKPAAANVAKQRPPVELMAYSIRQFCEAHSISEAMYYKLRLAGKGPRETRVGDKPIISKESAAEWRQPAAEEETASS